jgi:hypothetical protein
MANDIFRINAYAFRRDFVKGITNIKTQDRSFIDSAEAVFTEQGSYLVNITAQDEFGNHGELLLIVEVSNKLGFSASTQKTTYAPNENVFLNIYMADPWGRKRLANVSFDFAGLSYSFSVDSFGIFNFSVPYFAAPGEQKLVLAANSNGNIAKKEVTIYVEKKKSLDLNTNFGNGVLTVKLENKGNVELQNVSIVVCDLEGCRTKKTNISVLEQKNMDFQVSGKNASVKINYENESIERSVPLSITGGLIGTLLPATVAILALILLTITYAVWRFKKTNS